MPIASETAYFCYDPRDPSQSPDDRATWKLSTNGILISATMLHASRDSDPTDWDKVAILAELSDEAAPAAEEVASIRQTNAMLRAVLARRQADFA